MSELPFQPDDIALWSDSSLKQDGFEEFEFSPILEPEASMLQAVMGQNGPVLSAKSGSCLLIPIYVLKHKIGLVVHLWPDEHLSDEGAELIRKPFEKYPELKDEPIVGFVSSEGVGTLHAAQINEVRELVAELAPSSKFHDIAVQSRVEEADKGEGPIGVEICLNTAQGTLYVHDDNGPSQTINYQDYP